MQLEGVSELGGRWWGRDREGLAQRVLRACERQLGRGRDRTELRLLPGGAVGCRAESGSRLQWQELGVGPLGHPIDDRQSWEGTRMLGEKGTAQGWESA